MALKNIRSKILSQAGDQGLKPPFESFYIYFFVALLSYTTADLAIINYRPQMLPTEAPPKKARTFKDSTSNYAQYSIITKRNIFNSDGVIAEALSNKKDESLPTGSPAAPSKLPIKLLGTIVHFNPERSIATIHYQSGGKVSPYMVGDKIASLAQITQIVRRKVIFRNLNNNRLEYIEIPKDLVLNLGLNAPTTPSGNELVQKTGRFEYTVQRRDVENMLDDLPSLLKEARVVPNFAQGGQVEGYKFTWIKPSGIFDKLGFKVGDIIKGANREDINSPQKAMEALGAFKNSSDVILNMIRAGKEEEFNYKVE